MPTKAAAWSTAGRMRSTSSASAVSASGSCGAVMRAVEISLQDDLSGERIAQPALVARAVSRLAQRRACELRGEALVDLDDRKLVSPVQLARKAAGARRHLVRAAVGMQRQADHQRMGLPLVDERRNGRKPALVVLRLDGRQGARRAQARGAERHSDAARA